MIVIRTRTLLAIAALTGLAGLCYLYALTGIAAGTFSPGVSGSLLGGALPAIFALGAVPRQAIVGKRKLAGFSARVFEIWRAIAVGAPAAVIFGTDPAGSVTLGVIVSLSVFGMRSSARRIFANLAEMKALPYAHPGIGKSQATTRRANSALMGVVFAIAVTTPLAAWHLGAEAIPLAVAVVLMASLSGLLALHAEHLKREETRVAYDRHLEDFFSFCLANDVSDVIHYAGGAPEIVSTIAGRIKAEGRGVAVIARDVSSLERARKLGLRAVLSRKIPDLDRIVNPRIMRVHYPTDTQRGGHMVRFSKMRHILYSDKLPKGRGGFPAYLAMYDAIAVKTAPSATALASAARTGVDVVHIAKSGVTNPRLFDKKAFQA